MNTLIDWLAWLLLLGYLGQTLEFLVGLGGMKRIGDLPALSPGEEVPKVSIIIPARNEERNIEEALTSVLHLDYPDYEIIVLDDRSEDRSGEILEEMSGRFPQLKVVHIDNLPVGWLGKNHALWVGASHATGELLLFTDADIVMDPSVLGRAVRYLQERRLDHFTMTPDVYSDSPVLRIFMGAFVVFFCLYAMQWRAKNSKSSKFIGVGAFNLIRKEVYEAVGTFQAIAMRPDDDMKLGRLVKKNGYRQEAAIGVPMIRVEWYTSVAGMVNGLMKNSFAGLDYNLFFVISGTFVQFLFSVWPLIALFCTEGTTRLAYALCVLLMQVICFISARRHGTSLWSGPLFPVSTLLMIFIIWKATWQTLRNDGIYWRNTHYPLSALKANRV